MISKGFVVFGLLALFACQGATAGSLSGGNNDPALRATIGELIDQVKEIIKNLENLLQGVIKDALGTLGGLLETIESLKDTILGEGLDLIKDAVENALDFIKDKTSEAAELGVDIAQCIAGRKEQLTDLATTLGLNLTGCVTDIVNDALKMVNKDLVVINEIVSNVTAAPAKLAKCLISLRPITCVGNLIVDLSKMLVNVPGQVIAIVQSATQLVNDLPSNLYQCIDNIADSAISLINQVKNDIQKCVDDAISASTTQAPTAAPIVARRFRI